MANLTTERNTKIKLGNYSFSLPMEAGVKLYMGGIAAVNAAGYLVPAGGSGDEATRLPGLVQDSVDNSSGAAGAAYARVCRAVVGLDIGDLTQADVGKMTFFSDDHTLTKVAWTGESSAKVWNSPAGILLEIAEGLAWVDLQTSAPGASSVGI
jgi:hypothetical protein